jgi:hypothetical protein
LITAGDFSSAENLKRRDRQGAIKGLLTATRNAVSICDE